MNKNKSIISCKFIIDTRENDDLYEKLLKNGILKEKIEKKYLEIGDILLIDEKTGDTICIFERKTISDYISSVKSKRLANQILRMKTLLMLTFC